MVRRKPPPAPERALVHGLTPNQVVAYNLALAREQRGWTQDQAAQALERHLGVRWSKASVSQAERSVAGGFVRNFSADEIVAFARTFEVPVGWFFMPPPAWAAPGVPTRLEVPTGGEHGEALAVLVDLVFGDDAGQAALALRLQAHLEDAGSAPLTAAQERIVAMARHRVAALVDQSVSDLARWQTMLRSLANQLEDLEARSKRAIAAEAGLGSGDLRMPPGAASSEGAHSMEAPDGLEGGPPAPERTRRPASAKKSTKRRT
ncbi:MAG TPA: helix-turn-helix transcriptional regulator [Acidimicrobiales bacterium]|nr:helix-turn-helix transcriptional regulator [Acidimicrobiales bacterium]